MQKRNHSIEIQIEFRAKNADKYAYSAVNPFNCLKTLHSENIYQKQNTKNACDFYVQKFVYRYLKNLIRWIL